MPSRLPFLASGLAPSQFLRRLSRPLSTSPSLAQPNPSSNILSLDDQPASQTTSRIQQLVREKARAHSEAAGNRRRGEVQQMRDRKTSDDYMRQMPRRWRPGDVYSPQDLDPHQLAKWRKRAAPKDDLVDLLDINPLDMYKNFSMISEYMTSFGQIKHSRETGLRPRNQRKMAKAIRRAIGMGIHPSVHLHPEIIKKRIKGTP